MYFPPTPDKLPRQNKRAYAAQQAKGKSMDVNDRAGVSTNTEWVGSRVWVHARRETNMRIISTKILTRGYKALI